MDVFAGVGVTDFARAVDWYERLLGTPPTFEAHATEVVWSLADHGHLYVVQEPTHAGHALVTFFVHDLDAFVAAAAGRGVVEESREAYENGVTKVLFRDPDSNLVGVGGGGE